jgi:hypothetical protein
MVDIISNQTSTSHSALRYRTAVSTLNASIKEGSNIRTGQQDSDHFCAD